MTMQSSADIEKRSRKSGSTKRRDTKQRRDKRRVSKLWDEAAVSVALGSNEIIF